MADTLDSTFFDTFFAEPDTTKCIDCGAENGLGVLYTTEEGTAAKICPACKTKRAEEAEKRAAQSQASVDEWAWRDAWEEE